MTTAVAVWWQLGGGGDHHWLTRTFGDALFARQLFGHSYAPTFVCPKRTMVRTALSRTTLDAISLYAMGGHYHGSGMALLGADNTFTVGETRRLLPFIRTTHYRPSYG